jgi:putative ABC transport system permease protein
MKATPQAWLLKLLKRVCREDIYEMIEGDLIEEFEDNIEVYGLSKARRRFFWSALKFIHPQIIKRTRSTTRMNYHNMFAHYVFFAFRQAARNKTLSLINVIGLAIALCTFFLISQYVSYEMSFDTFHENKDHVFRVAYKKEIDGEVKLASARNFIGISKLAQQSLPEVTAATVFDRSAQSGTFQFIYNGKTFYQPGSFYQTDDSFFQVFPSLLSKGDPSSVLSDPHNLVLSQKMASLIFGNEDPIGKKIENRSYSYSDVGSFVVTGVLIDVPENAHLHIDFIVKDSNNEAVLAGDVWAEPTFYSYLTLAPGTDPLVVTDKLNLLLKGLNTEHPKTANVTLILQPVTDIHNTSDLAEELEPNGNALLLYLLSAIGIAVLISAWINYVNIETGRFISRTKEVAVRKILGSVDGSLIAQFFTEFIAGTFLSAIVAIILMFLISPSFRELSDLPEFNYWSSPVWIGSCALFISGVLITGVLMAMLFSKRNVRLTSTTKITRSGYNNTGRRILIGFQFTCSISLIAILMVIHDQTTFMMLTNKKIDIENIVSIRNPTVYTNDDSVSLAEYNAFQHELTSNTMVNSTTGSSAIPGMEIEVTFINRLKKALGDPYDPTPYKVLFTDHDYIPFYNLKLTAGRNYSTERGDDNNWNTVILNETARRALGFRNAQEAVDTEVYFHLFGGDFKKFKVIGVVEDYHHETAKHEIQPTILALNKAVLNGTPISFQQVFFSVKLNPGTNPQDGLTLIEQSWKKQFPDKPFEFFFQDEYYDRQFKTERKFGSVFGLFTGVSIVIACLGILGMSSFETISRAKEVSVRKVLGATVANIMTLLSVTYLRLIVVSSLICVPIIYWLSAYWLDNYPTRISITIWFFVAPVVVLAALVALSAGIHTIKVATANPVDNLNHE